LRQRKESCFVQYAKISRSQLSNRRISILMRGALRGV
jgi:hypothetical protein